MPYRRKPKTRPRRRRRRGAQTQRTRKIYKPVVFNPRGGHVMPDSLITKVRYHENISLDPSAGLVDNYLFSCNNIYDPNHTGVGHQPQGRDELAQFYNHYVVLGAKITAKFTSNGTGVANGVGIAGVGLQRSTTLVSDINTVIERRQARNKILTAVGAKGTCTVVNYFSAKKLFGYLDLGDSAETRTPIGASPTDQGYFNVFLAPVSSTYDLAATTVSVTIDYIVKFMERSDLLGS